MTEHKLRPEIPYGMSAEAELLDVFVTANSIVLKSDKILPVAALSK